MIKKTRVLLLLLWVPTCYANLNADLNHFFDGLGFSANATHPSAYQGQQAGFYTGGSLYLRNSVRNVSLAQIDLPKVNAGCGGIDLYTGGFSFINGQGMKTLMQNIMHGATGYVAELALEQAIPQATNVMRHMQDIANTVNRFNINSCHAASQLVGSLGLQTQESQRQVCKAAAMAQNRVGSWSGATQYCRDVGHYQSVMAQAAKSRSYKHLVVDNVNVAWKAIQHNPFFSSNVQLAELMMTLSGAIIVKDGQLEYLPAQVQQRNLMKALLKGGRVLLYRCDTTDSSGCLHPRLSPITIHPNAALETQVAQVLQDMVEKIEADTPLTTQEIGFLQSTRLPVYKILNVQAAFKGTRSVLDVTAFSELIATDVLSQYLEENLQAVKAAGHAMQYPPSVMQPFMQGINAALRSVREQRGSAYKKIQLVDTLVARAQLAEQMLAGRLSSQLYNHLKWARGAR